MNHASEQEIFYRLLKILSQESNLGQRDMAKKMGISLGKVNYCISELATRGWIKITRFRSAKHKIPYTYMLTPKGLEEKGRLAVRFLWRKVSEYEEIKMQIEELHTEVQQEGFSNPDSQLNATIRRVV